MNVIVNGKEQSLGESTETISALLKEYQIENGRVAVEQNGTILTKEEWETSKLSEKDRIEIVHFVGGG